LGELERREAGVFLCGEKTFYGPRIRRGGNVSIVQGFLGSAAGHKGGSIMSNVLSRDRSCISITVILRKGGRCHSTKGKEEKRKRKGTKPKTSGDVLIYLYTARKTHRSSTKNWT